MKITKYITLDLSQRGGQALVDAKQGDDASRFVEIALTDNGVPWVPPEGAAAFFRALKPDGHSCYNPAEITAEGTVVVELTAQALVVPGMVRADVSWQGADGQVLSSLSFDIMVEPAPLGDLAESRDELRVYEEQLQRIEDGMADLGDLGIAGKRVTAIRVNNVPHEEVPSIVVAVSLEDGSIDEHIINLDANDRPTRIITNDVAVPIEWEGF